MTTLKDKTDCRDKVGLRKRRPPIMEKTAACRCLFGPVNHVETKRTFQREMAIWQEEAQKTWNFDFVREIPCTGRYEWERITNVIPEPYTSIPKSRTPSVSCNRASAHECTASETRSDHVNMEQEHQTCDSGTHKQPSRKKSLTRIKTSTKRKQAKISDLFKSLKKRTGSRSIGVSKAPAENHTATSSSQQ